MLGLTMRLGTEPGYKIVLTNDAGCVASPGRPEPEPQRESCAVVPSLTCLVQ